MALTPNKKERRTSVDVVYEHLLNSIVTLELLPGDKISEADIASQFGVSRQPVRDAFSRLDSLGLLLIQPQRATEVKRFSLREIKKSRFIRLSVECEVIRRAAKVATQADHALLDAQIVKQKEAVAKEDYTLFGKLDFEFHQTLCEIAGVDFAYEVIAFEKGKFDRMCLLSLPKEDRVNRVLMDHELITACVKEGDSEGAVAAGLVHLTRLDATIDAILERNPEYFED